MDRIPSNHRLAERILHRFVQSGFWRIDDLGQVWIGSRRAEKRMPSGYLMIRKMVNGKRIVGLAHRLVWQSIRGDIPAGAIINHKNGLKYDNRIGNLELSDYSRNMRHAHSSGLLDQRGQNNPAAKLTDNQVVQIRMGYASGAFTMQQLADQYGVRTQHVSRLVRGERRDGQRGPIVIPVRFTGQQDPDTGRFVGKHAAGRLLDGVDHSEFPA